MQVRTGLDELVAQYVCTIIGIPKPTTPFIGFAVYDDTNTIVAGIVISNFRGTDCEVLMAADSPKWARKGVMRYIFNYIFNTAQCIRCTCITTKKNARTRRFLEGIGFELEGNLRRGYDGRKDALIYGLLREDCRFLGVNDGEEVRASSPASAGPVRDGSRANRHEQRDGDSAS